MNRKKLLRLAAIGVCTVVALICDVQLVRYVVDWHNTRELNRRLAAQYHTEAITTDTPEPITLTAEPMPGTVQPPTPQATPVQSVAAPKSTYDPFGGYPNNRYREILPRFKQLHQINKDICGWLIIGTDLDQAVVQRDNTYYLTRDYTGKHNVNGAIFLDEQVKLLQRPTCYILYGHNMKTEAMFGMLHKYDNAAYLREHAVITFDTIYEEGQYAVFAVGTVSIDSGSSRFADYYNLPKTTDDARMSIIQRLQNISDFNISLDVSADDQLLILVTCVGNDTERRFVAARRLRDGESSQSLNMTYLLMEKR